MGGPNCLKEYNRYRPSSLLRVPEILAPFIPEILAG